ncbi:MAG TPA: hypothetical protein VKD72_03890 [Gemmataceae bacterium]|nr:hypothetical protein [Gemmataceae bacterium]
MPRFGDQVLRLLVRFSADFLCTIGDVHSYSDDADGHRPQRLREGDADGKASNKPQAPGKDLFDDFIEHGRSPYSLMLGRWISE